MSIVLSLCAAALAPIASEESPRLRLPEKGGVVLVGSRQLLPMAPLEAGREALAPFAGQRRGGRREEKTNNCVAALLNVLFANASVEIVTTAVYGNAAGLVARVAGGPCVLFRATAPTNDGSCACC